MEITFDEEFEYIPIWNGNRKNKEPIKFRLRYLTMAEREKLITTEMVAVGKELRRVTRFDNTEILNSSIVTIENLRVNGTEIKTAGLLIFHRGLSELCREVAEHAAGMNVKPILKN